MQKEFDENIELINKYFDEFSGKKCCSKKCNEMIDYKEVKNTCKLAYKFSKDSYDFYIYGILKDCLVRKEENNPSYIKNRVKNKDDVFYYRFQN